MDRLAAETQTGRRTRSRNERHRAVIPPVLLDEDGGRRAARSNSDTILRPHAVHEDEVQQLTTAHLKDTRTNKDV